MFRIRSPSGDILRVRARVRAGEAGTLCAGAVVSCAPHVSTAQPATAPGTTIRATTRWGGWRTRGVARCVRGPAHSVSGLEGLAHLDSVCRGVDLVTVISWFIVGELDTCSTRSSGHSSDILLRHAARMGWPNYYWH